MQRDTRIKPLVSVLILTYNHSKFIIECLESILSQKGDFDLELLIHDDASTDGTQEIIKEYYSKYPDIIKPIYQIENKYSKGIRPTVEFQLPRAKGKYIAICEGDDYWTDENKIQKQIDLMENNSNLAISFHPVKVVDEKGMRLYSYPKLEDDDKFTLEGLVRHNFIQTNSVFYRKINYENYTKKAITPGDWYLHIFHAVNGGIGFIKEEMSAYRKHDAGMWSGSDDKKQLRKMMIKYSANHFLLFEELKELLKNNPQLLKLIDINTARLFSKVLSIDNSQLKLAFSAIKNNPELALNGLQGFNALYLNDELLIKNKQGSIKRRNQELDKLKAKYQELEIEYKKLKISKKQIENKKYYKIGRKTGLL